MSQSHPTIDNNSVSVGLGTWNRRVYNDLKHSYDTFPTPKAISINPSNKALRIEIIPRTLSGTQVPERMPIDNNSYSVAGALTNDANLTITPLSVDVIIDIPALRADVTLLP